MAISRGGQAVVVVSPAPYATSGTVIRAPWPSTPPESMIVSTFPSFGLDKPGQIRLPDAPNG
jgi:hypothetical protein